MSTPNKKYKSQKELTSPTIAQKIQMLGMGKEIGQTLELDKLPEVLESVRSNILLPLVSWLDKPIFPDTACVDYTPSPSFIKKRGVRVFESCIIDIWFERSGRWFIRLRGSHSVNTAFKEANSQQLAEIMLQKSDDFLNLFLRDISFLDEI